jgi:hypothetical protein
VNEGYQYRERVGPDASGRTVLAHLAGRYRHSSEDTWRRRLAAGEILLDGHPPRAADTLRAGQSLIWRRPPWEEPPVPLGFAVLHLDEHLLAVAKPRAASRVSTPLCPARAASGSTPSASSSPTPPPGSGSSSSAPRPLRSEAEPDLP